MQKGYQGKTQMLVALQMIW